MEQERDPLFTQIEISGANSKLTAIHRRLRTKIISFYILLCVIKRQSWSVFLFN